MHTIINICIIKVAMISPISTTI